MLPKQTSDALLTPKTPGMNMIAQDNGHPVIDVPITKIPDEIWRGFLGPIDSDE